MPTCVRRWTLGLALAVLASLAGATPASAGSLTARAYYDGAPTYTYHLNCFTGLTEPLVGTWVGYYGTPDVTWPRAGDLYYVRLAVYVLGNPCSGGIASALELVLPPSTQFAISAANPVYCYYTGLNGQTVPITNGCPQSPQAGLYGARFNPTLNPYTWTLATGTSLEIRVPVVSSQPLSGIGGGHYLYGAVTPEVGVWTFPQQGVFVAPNDLIFQDGFSSGNLGAWSSSLTDAGDLSVQSWAAMRTPGHGLVATVDDLNPLFVQNNSPNDQGRYRMRFYLHPYTFDPGEAQAHFRVRVFLAFDETPAQRRVMALVLKRQGGLYSLAARTRRDDNVQVDTSFHPISAAAHSIEIDWVRATGPGHNNGTLRLWIDDVLKQTLSGIDNDTAGIDFVRLGTLSLKGGAGGTLLFDEMESRSATPVGP